MLYDSLLNERMLRKKKKKEKISFPSVMIMEKLLGADEISFYKKR